MERIRADIDAGHYDAASAAILQLPDNVRMEILSYLEISDIFNLFEANRSLTIWANTSPILWQMIFQRNFPDTTMGELRDAIIQDTKQSIDIAHDNYRTITLAYAFVLRRRKILNNWLVRHGDSQFMVLYHADTNTRVVFNRNNVIDIIPPPQQRRIPEPVLDIFYDLGYILHDNTTRLPQNENAVEIYIAFRLFALGFTTPFYTIRNQPGIAPRRLIKCAICDNPNVTLKYDSSTCACNVSYCSRECAYKDEKRHQKECN
jgi:hypothetical protein